MTGREEHKEDAPRRAASGDLQGAGADVPPGVRSAAAGRSEALVLARKNHEGADVLVRTIRNPSPDPEVRARWTELCQRQADLAAMLDHDGILYLREFDLHEGDDALTARFVYDDPGPLESLEAVIDSFDWPTMRTVTMRLLEALGYAHARNVFHRALRPQAVLVARDEHALRVVIADFALATVSVAAVSAAAMSAPVLEQCGGFCAPEIREQRDCDVGAWTDIHSVGAIVHRWAFGRPPCIYSPPAPQDAAREDAPAGLSAWLACLLEARPTARPLWAADAAWMLARLDDADAPPRGEELSDARHYRAPLPADWRQPRRTARPAPIGPGYSGDLHRFRELALIGRDAACDRLWDALVRLHADARPRAIFLRGNAGTGKSRLAEWLVYRAREAGGAVVLSATHSPMGLGPADGLGPMLSRFMRATGLDAAAVRERAEQVLSNLGFDASDPSTDVLRELAAGQTEARGADAAAAPAQAHGIARRFDALLALTRAVARQRPVIVWLDDVQWAVESLDWVEHVLGSREPCPVLFVMTVQEEALANRPVETVQIEQLCERADVETIVVEPLSNGEQHALLEGLAPLEPELASELVERTAGNPLFAIRWVRDWIQSGMLEADESAQGAWKLHARSSEHFPDSLFEVWNAVLERFAAQFDDRARGHAMRALEIAAALGQEIELREWETTCELLGVAMPGQLVAAAHAYRLIVEKENGLLGFTHGMLRETLERHARDAGRQVEYHRGCARMIEALYPAARAGVVERLGLHLFEAGDFEACLPLLLRGVSHLGNTGNYHRAIFLLQRYDQACDALELGAHDRHRIVGWLRRAWVFEAMGNLQHMGTMLARAEVALEHTCDAHLRGVLLWGKSAVAYEEGLLDEARRHLEEALTLFERDGRTRELALTHLRLGTAYRELGDRSDVALEHWEKADAYFEKSGDTLGVALARRGKARAALTRGDFEVAMALIDEVIEQIRRLGNDLKLADAYNLKGDIARTCGQRTLARTCYLRALETWGSFGDHRKTVARLNLGFLEVDGDDFEAARVIFEQVCEHAEQHGLGREQVHGEVGLLTCALGLGAWDAAAAHLERIEAARNDGIVLGPEALAILARGHEIARRARKRKLTRRLASLTHTS